MKKKVLLLAVLSTFLLLGCKNGQNGSSSGGSNSGSNQPTEDLVTVNFYLDYNQKIVKNIYHSCKVANNSLITDIPSVPTEAPYPEFPVFKGWSYKELIASEDDLWDFTTDKVNTNNNVMDLYGYWAAEGE